MRSILILILMGLSPVMIDINLFRKRATRKGSNQNIEYEDSEKRQKLKKNIKRYKNKKFKRKKIYKKKHYKFKGSYAKDSRYSNQKSLRRMYRNS